MKNNLYKKRNIALSIVIVITTFCLIAYIGIAKTNIISASDEWKNAETFTKDALYFYKDSPVFIKIEISKGTSTDSLLQLLKMIDNADTDLIKDCRSINIASDEIIAGDEEIIMAMTVKNSVTFIDGCLDEDTFIHEMSHVYDNSNHKPSGSAEFQKIYNSKEFKMVIEESGVYGDDDDEGWAIGSSYYRTKPEYLASVAPNAYEYFNSIFSD